MICLHVLGLHLSWVEILNAVISPRLGIQSIKTSSWPAVNPFLPQLLHDWMLKNAAITMRDVSEILPVNAPLPQSSSPIIAQIHEQPGKGRLEIPESFAHRGDARVLVAATQVRQDVAHQRVVDAIEQAGIDPLRPGLHRGVLFLLPPGGIEPPAFVVGDRGQQISRRDGGAGGDGGGHQALEVSARYPGEDDGWIDGGSR